MGLTERDFAGGVAAVCALNARENARRDEAARVGKALARDNSKEGEAAYFRALNVLRSSGGPMWQKVCGFSPKKELSIDPGERRAGIRRLLRVVERMFRDELKAADVDRDGGSFNLDGGEASFSGRSVAWEPLHEICVYLEISKAQLNAFSLQRTGLKVMEICDCIRVEGVRTTLREKFRPLVRTWVEKVGKSKLGDDLVNAAWQFLKWMRGGGRCETRKKFALELGMTSRERLDRAVMVSERDTLEAVEIAVAMRAIQEALGTADSTPHGAGCDEVAREGREATEKEEGRERDAGGEGVEAVETTG